MTARTTKRTLWDTQAYGWAWTLNSVACHHDRNTSPRRCGNLGFHRVRNGAMDTVKIANDGLSHTFILTIEGHASHISAATGYSYLDQKVGFQRLRAVAADAIKAMTGIELAEAFRGI